MFSTRLNLFLVLASLCVWVPNAFAASGPDEALHYYRLVVTTGTFSAVKTDDRVDLYAPGASTAAEESIVAGVRVAQSGASNEPTIVIQVDDEQFKRLDAAVRTPGVSILVRPSKPHDEWLPLPPAALACDHDADCVKITWGECSCHMGGKASPISRDASEGYLKGLRGSTKGYCIAAISKDPSCGATPVCINHQCALDPNPALPGTKWIDRLDKGQWWSPSNERDEDRLRDLLEKSRLQISHTDR